MKKIIIAASVWAGLWGVGMVLFEQKVLKTLPDGTWLIGTPFFLAAALFAWGVISGKGGAGTIDGTVWGFILALGAFFGSFLLASLLTSELLMDDRIAWLMAGGIVGGVTGASGEMIRQAKH